MADVKWIKITTDIFDDEKILLIESLPEPYAIITVWFKLLCLAGKQNNSGVFMMGKIAYTDKMLATIFRMKEAMVTMALQTFEQFGMVEIIDGVITIPNWEKHQSLDKFELAKEKTRQRVARHREKQKELAECNAPCNVTVTQSNADRIEENKDKDKDKDKDNSNTETKRKRFVPPTLAEVQAYCEERNNGVDAERFIDYYSSNGWMVGKNKMKDWKAAVRTWEKNGYSGKTSAAKNPNKSYDLDEFFEVSVARAWKETKNENPPKTAGTDEVVRKKAEELKAKLG